MDLRRLPIIALVVGLAVTHFASFAAAADITFFCGPALQSAMKELIPEFQKASGHNVKIDYVNIGTATSRIRKGDAADLAVVSPQQWDTLQKEAKLAPGPRVLLGKIGLGLFVSKGAARPDIGSVDSFRRTLLNARSIAVRDPKEGSPVGAYVLPLFDRLGIADDIKSRIRITSGNPGSFQAVVKGEAEIGFSTMTEIVASPEVDLAGPLPAEIQNFIAYALAIPANAKEAGAAKALAEFLISPRAISVFKAKGIEPS